VIRYNYNRSPVSKLVLLLLLAAVTVLQSGCLASHLIQGVKDLGMTASDRRDQLAQAIKILHRGLARERAMIAPELLLFDVRPELEKKLRDVLRGRRFVDVTIDNSEFSEGAWEAESSGRASAFKSPAFIVEEYEITEHWTFVVNEGWRLRDFVLVPNAKGVSTRGPLGL